MKRPSDDERSTSVLNIVADVGVDIEKYGLVLSVEIYINRRLTQHTNMEKEKNSQMNVLKRRIDQLLVSTHIHL